MAEHKTIHLPISIAPNVIQIVGFDDLKSYEKFVIKQAKAQLQDEITLQELDFTGKPDLSNLKVEYPIPLELQENGSAECHFPVSVPYLNDND